MTFFVVFGRAFAVNGGTSVDARRAAAEAFQLRQGLLDGLGTEVDAESPDDAVATARQIRWVQMHSRSYTDDPRSRLPPRDRAPLELLEPRASDGSRDQDADVRLLREDGDSMTFYILVVGQSVFVKTEDFFETPIGRIQIRTRSWTEVDAQDEASAREIGDRVKRAIRRLEESL